MTPSCLQPCRRPPFASGWSLNHDHGPHDLRLFTSACQHIIFHHLKNLPLHILFLKALLPPSKHVPFIPPSHPTKGSLFLSCASSPPLPLHLAKAQRKVDLILKVVLFHAQSFNNHIAINNLVSMAVDGNFIISIFYMSPNIQVRKLKPWQSVNCPETHY